MLSDRDILWAVGIQSHQKVYPEDVTVAIPKRKRHIRKSGSRLTTDTRTTGGTKTYVTGNIPIYPLPNKKAQPVKAFLKGKNAKWHTVTWRDGTKGPLKAKMAAMRVRAADGLEVRQRVHLPG